VDEVLHLGACGPYSCQAARTLARSPPPTSTGRSPTSPGCRRHCRH